MKIVNCSRLFCSVHNFIIDFRLHDFTIGLSNQLFQRMTAGSYDVCTKYVGVVGSGVTVNLTCDTPGMKARYLFIQIPGQQEILTLCEVEVYGGNDKTIMTIIRVHIILF